MLKQKSCLCGNFGGGTDLKFFKTTESISTDSKVLAGTVLTDVGLRDKKKFKEYYDFFSN